MPGVTNSSVNLVNRIACYDITNNNVAAEEVHTVSEDNQPVTSSDSATVSFRQVNEEASLEKYLKTNNFAAFAEEMENLDARVKLVSLDCAVAYSEISELVVSDSQPEADANAQIATLAKQLDDLEITNLQSEEINRIAALSTATTISSSKEICAAVSEAIGVMSEEYLQVFQDAVEKNIAFYSDFTDFIAKLSSYVGAKDDKTTFNKSAFLKELKALILVYPLNKVVPATTLYPPVADDTVKGTSKEDCVAWAKMMGLNSDSDNVIRKLDDGTYVVTIDVSPLGAIENSANSASESMNSAQWSAWQAGLDIQKDTIQTAMQTLTQRYTNANSTFDNLVKVLSSVINSLLDSDKAFFNI